MGGRRLFKRYGNGQTMRIGFDISQTGNNKAGCGYFADSLILVLSELDSENEYILYPHFGTTFWDPNGEKNTRKLMGSNMSRKRIGRDFASAFDFWDNPCADVEDRLGNPHVIHANNYFCPTGLKKARVVYTLYDLSFFDLPDLTTEENRSKCFGGVFSAAVSADFILSISQHSLDRFLEVYPHYPKERTAVAYLGSRFSSANEEDLPGNFSGQMEPKKFWLSVCTLEPRKNLRRLLRAFREYLKSTSNAFQLVLAGGKGWMQGDLESFIGQLGLEEYVQLLGYVTDEELRWLYRNCFAFVYPSLYEGFGLPVLEAMDFGAPVITSNTTSLPEVAGDAAHFVDPLNDKAITEGLLALEQRDEYRAHLKEKAFRRAKQFSWERSGKRVLQVYEQVMRLPKFERNRNVRGI
jgi:glycosyltransferase involved in cell wall biosynthesis